MTGLWIFIHGDRTFISDNKPADTKEIYKLNMEIDYTDDDP